ncbi:MAG: integrase domain-containing protein [Gammaproteobacteria bacterium]|nr:integrase domain-containing protein [Gammaproteobacteria bacterium]
MKRLEYELKQMTFHNRDGSYVTQKNRRNSLSLMAKELHQLGFNQMNVHSLRRKHIDALIKLWFERGISAATIKNKMSHLRWWARKVGKENMIPSDNQELTIPRRALIPEKTKAQYLGRAELDSIPDARIRLSIELQQEFGLRKEECLKFSPFYADQGSVIRLKGSWTKGGRARVIPIVAETQRELLDRLSEVAQTGSMIPVGTSFASWRNHYDRVVQKCGFANLHGLRHGYAQRRYQALTGWASPFAGGPPQQNLQKDLKTRDVCARLQISQELGHNRLEITSVYLGR